MSEELWRWWEEQGAPDDSDLHPHHPGGACFPLVLMVLFLIIVTLGVAGWKIFSTWG